MAIGVTSREDFNMAMVSPGASLCKMDFVACNDIMHRGGSKISGKGVHIDKDVRVRFTDFISFFLNIP